VILAPALPTKRQRRRISRLHHSAT